MQYIHDKMLQDVPETLLPHRYYGAAFWQQITFLLGETASQIYLLWQWNLEVDIFAVNSCLSEDTL